MAQLFPLRSACRFDTSGERRLAERLEKKLGADYLCWYNAPVGANGLQPDFVIAHPERGLLVLEVKDWRLDTIRRMDQDSATLLVPEGEVVVSHPLRQARKYATELVSALQRDTLLRQSKGLYAGRLAVPFGWAVVFTRMTRRQFEQTDLHEVLPPERVLFQDEMLESVSDDEFANRIDALFPAPFPCRLSGEQIDRIRYHLYPEVRISSAPGQFGLFDNHQDALPSLIRVMDLQQEQLARSLGDGHRVIHGVAGSGKTMILAYRCIHLAAAAKKPILVLSYSRALAGRLEQMMAERGLAETVQVRRFLAWCHELLRTHGVALPTERGQAFYAALVAAVEAALESGEIPRGQYSAVLIDEGHDFAPEWFRIAVQMVDPDTDSLLVLYDDAQTLYGNLRRRDFSFASVGIQAQGRTTILRLNYRNTLEVLSVARALATGALRAEQSSDDGVPLIAPESAGRRGPLPKLLVLDSEWQQWHSLVEQLQDAAAHGRRWSEMAVLYRHASDAVAIERALGAADIPFISGRASRTRDRLFGSEDQVKVVSMHSSKGLEFPLVVIPSLHILPAAGEDELLEERLLYVAMTRALESLVLLATAATALTERVGQAVEQVQRALAEA